MLPDADVVLEALGIPDTGALGHRGASHSPLFALAIAGLIAAGGQRFGLRPLYSGVFVFLAVVSHGVLDALTTDGRGILFLWPLSDRRFEFPWRPIPDMPCGFASLSARGLRVAAVELIYFLPLYVWVIWPRRRRRAPERPPPMPGLGHAGARAAGIVFAVMLCLAAAELWLRDTRLISAVHRPSVSRAAGPANLTKTGH